MNCDITLYPNGNSYTRPIRNIERVELVSDPSEYEGDRTVIAEKEQGTMVIFPSYMRHR